jgi:hypothetical protein
MVEDLDVSKTWKGRIESVDSALAVLMEANQDDAMTF